MEAIDVFIKDIFNSIFIHRSKDFHENIRLICIKHLFAFVSFDINTTIKTEYLKYYGWALYDRNDLVRLESVQAIKSLIEVRIFVFNILYYVIINIYLIKECGLSCTFKKFY